MKFALVFATVAAAIVAQDEVAPNNKPFEIVGGHEAKVGQHRYLAGLKPSDTSASWCGGSLIASNTILTAAHCTGKGLKFAVVGTHHLSGASDGESARVIKEIRHPQYSNLTRAYDMAVLILDRNITGITPVPVSFETVSANVETWVRGWGSTSGSGTQSKVLKEVSVLTWDSAQASIALDSTLDDSMLAAGGEEGEDACQGDSGGPLTIEQNGAARLVGVVSWGFGCGELGMLGVYGRLSAARAFIEPHLAKKNLCVSYVVGEEAKVADVGTTEVVEADDLMVDTEGSPAMESSN
ncbi:hypothetical protein H310_14240 [Aphanomyces invadans]|uniref:Peptidase S1 domain-containing protein n=1 Tax=Aphanomyces invadans TaxID=157072 RepID=A0A024TCL0_9STRA|nr:hypothetical protein H310_14240 [Aphanomyces invadans]ETV91077.1 hypothetical protein H310_14240 [Aphanomyces invadans]|eukprot:XP_008880273.1 hypothetical protein H310_14240 [Aphanomyces invadans]